MEPIKFTLFIIITVAMVVLLVNIGCMVIEYSNISEMTVGIFTGACIVWGSQYLMSVLSE